MPTDLGPPFSPDWRGRPPHMSPNDAVLWTVWYPQHTQPTDAIYFDVAVSRTPWTPDPNVPEEMLRMWHRVNARRIDALIVQPDRIRLCELRWNASESAIGRLLVYLDLWTLDPPFPQPVELVLISNKVHDDWRPTAERLRITVIHLPDLM